MPDDSVTQFANIACLGSSNATAIAFLAGIALGFIAFLLRKRIGRIVRRNQKLSVIAATFVATGVSSKTAFAQLTDQLHISTPTNYTCPSTQEAFFDNLGSNITRALYFAAITFILLLVVSKAFSLISKAIHH